ncbi:AAA domain-containing protein [Neobacillus sp. PS3-40]|uniref:AAA domain-containing protein n=1 Tax=Neobacillus sp. PS3-40 TaxID=3070679 RepID=UPI0027E1DBE9|nr:AAA domain-containing protein [Neobacillus sp. PS3-40]WML44346.1 AAA domain-containing protein [Neobacillus sp. PS3-40]
MKPSTLHKEKAIRLFTYLKELSLLRSPLARDLHQYENYLFMNEIMDEPECLSPLITDVKDIWVEIKKPIRPIFPDPHQTIRSWLSPSFQYSNSNYEPKLLENIPNPHFKESEPDGEIPKYLHILDYPEVQSKFDDYIKEKWTLWKDEFLRVEKVQEIYTKLFSIYQKQKKLGDQYELLMGIGLLNWKTPDGQVVHRHILTVSCHFQFDSSSGIIRIVPSTESISPELEQDMLELEYRLDNKALLPIKEKMDELTSEIWNKSLLNSIFKSFVYSLSANGTYNEEVYQNKRESTQEPDLSYSPSLILRKKSEKGFQHACSKIIENMGDSTSNVPQGILRIFEEMEDYQEQQTKSSFDQQFNLNKMDNNIYFPLHANEEQRKIISNLETRNGVLVQGPPGTGKSHTIANLISHLLSSGKRVLITSETPRALKVLKEKIPIELQALCVSLLGEDSKSFKDLESVVQVISNKRDTWDQELSKKEIDNLTLNLLKMKEKQALLQQQLRSIREKETYEFQFINGEYKGTAQKIAGQLNKAETKYSWMTDFINMDADLPLNSIEFAEVLELLNQLNEHVQEQIQLSIPSPDLIMTDLDFNVKINREQALLQDMEQFKPLNEQATEQFSHISQEKRSKLVLLLNELKRNLIGIEQKNEAWLKNALGDLFLGKFRPWEEFYGQVRISNDSIKENASTHNLSEITGQGQTSLTQLHSDVILLRSHFENGKGLGMPLIRPKVVKDAWYIVKDIRIDGRKCDTLEAIILLDGTVKTDHTLKMIELMISDQLKIQVGALTSRLLRLANIEDIMEPFSLLFAAKQLIEKIQKEFTDVPIIIQKTLNKENISLFSTYLDFISLKEELKTIQDELLQMGKNIQKSIETQVMHPIVDELMYSIRTRNIDKYRVSINIIIELDEYSQKSKRCEELSQKLKKVLPKLYSKLLNQFDYQYWKIRFIDLEKAFNWAKVNAWFIQFSQTSESEVTKDLDELEDSIKKTISILGAQKAWFSTLSTMTEGQRQHLLAWNTSMRKAGKRTGKNAYIHLQDAQKHMSECRDSIPTWIMPLYRVFETFDVRPNLFDVVIMDEASQSGPDAVILQYIAKKLIVVGDDKQISPEYVGIKGEDILFLRKQYLFDFKLSDLLSLENSFFDLANVLFGGRITLREHFRCMPEIIEFSNRISYSNTPLIPLRQYPPNRLEPINTRHVPTGYREGSGSKVYNRHEAEALVKEIKACISNPQYEGKSMGIISLQNEGQAQLIEKLLIEEIGPEEMEKRQIICGDAYAFQGDERDVIFLSMVAAPGETGMRALATEKDKRRFNVAVSRAKDQLWLFHTPTLNDFRNKECLRYQLISYCENPPKEILESNRALCESDFEREVFDQISARGYRIIPQHEVAGYRIDMVIQGSKGRIAVECDGDQWHGPDRFDYDMNRQRILERCGWNFWRVRGSDFYYNSEKSLSSLWETLKYYEIDPIGYESYTTEINENNMDEKIVLINHHDVPIQGNAKDQKQEEDMHEGISVKVRLPEKTQNTQNTRLLEEDKHQSKAEHSVALLESTAVKQTPIKGYSEQITLDLKQPSITLKDGLKPFLENKGFEVLDKRSKGGALWLIGGQELNSFITVLKKEQIHFTFAYNGSKSTSQRPAWYTIFQD